MPGYREVAAPPPASMVDLGAPPDDAMAAERWAHQLLMRQAHDAMMDASMSQERRRKEVRVILAAAAKHMNDAMRYDVAQIIARDKAETENRKRAKAAAKLQKVGAPRPGAKIIPIRRDG
jgi:hypothetical protein